MTRHSVTFVTCLALFATVCFVPGPGLVWAAEAPARPAGEQRLTGLVMVTPEEAQEQLKSVPRITRRRFLSRALPTKVKNIQYLPVVAAQTLENCGAFAPSYYYKTYQEAREHGWTRPDPAVNPERVMSPGFTFPLSNGGVNAGASVPAVMQVICDAGIVPLSVLPEDWDFTAYPPEAAWRAAILYRGESWATIDIDTEEGIAALKEHLAGGDLAVFATLLYHDTFDSYPSGPGVDNGVMIEQGQDVWVAHAFTLVGYDDEKPYTVNGEARTGAFLAVNSWGQGWGVYDEDAGSKGFIWFSYDYVQNKRADAWPAFTMVDRIAYQPTQFAVFDASFSIRSAVSYGAYPGSPANRLADGFGLRTFSSGDFPFVGRIVMDATAYDSVGGLAYTLSLFDSSSLVGLVPQGTKTGNVYSFHLERADGTIIEPPRIDEPVPILAGIMTHVHAGPFVPCSLGEDFDGLTTKSLRMAWCDWDRDGDPDAAVTGSALIRSEMTRVYRNYEQDGPQLADLGAGLPGLTRGQVAWGDYDLDGLPDLAIGGMVDNSVPLLKVFKNTGATAFVDSAMALEPLTDVELAWGDYNNDGRLDLVASGYTAQGAQRAVLYRNDAAAGLVQSGIALPQKCKIAVSWADMDNDGWLDLAMGDLLYRNQQGTEFSEAAALDTGVFSSHAWGDYNGDGRADLAYCLFDVSGETEEDRVKTMVFRNDGDFAFTNIQAGLIGVQAGSLAWGDFDNDGRLDLAVSGNTTSWIEEKGTRIYRQKPDGTFQDVGPDVLDLSDGTVAWVDLNRDGALDLVASGVNPFNGTPPLTATTTAYQSRIGAAGFIGQSNRPPSAPTKLRAAWDGAAQTVRLEWDRAQDPEAPASLGLEYYLRVGTREGATDVVDDRFPLTMGGFTQHSRLSDTQPGRLLKGLAPGRYYWSVQAIDAGMAVSSWSEPHRFTLGTGGFVSGDANGDGKLDVADVVAATLMARAARPARPDLADLDADGRVTTLDANEIAGQIVASKAPPFVTAAQAAIGPNGGIVSATDYGVELVIPAGAFQRDTTIALKASSTANDYGPGALPLSWRIEGLPSDFLEPLTLRLQDIRPDMNPDPYAAVGSFGFTTSDGGVRWAFAKKALTRADGGWLNLEIIPPDEPVSPPVAAAGRTTLRGADATMPEYGFTLHIYVLGANQWTYSGGHFTITGPQEVKDKLPQLAQHLEDAYAKFVTEFGFVVNKRDWTRHPIEVSILDMGEAPDGTPREAYAYPGWGYNSMGIQLSPYLLLNRTEDEVRVTAGHEFFHIVQYFYYPGSFLARRGKPVYLWWNEATCTFMETVLTKEGPKYFPGPLQNNFLLTFNGYDTQTRIPDDGNGLREMAYGYAMGNLARHLVQMNNNDPKVIRLVYERLQKGEFILSALQPNDGSFQTGGLFSTFYEHLFLGDLIPVPGQTRTLWRVADKSRRFATLKSDSQRGFRFPEATQQFLGASYGFLAFESPFLNATQDDKLGFQLSADEEIGNILYVIGYDQKKQTHDLIGYSRPDSETGTHRLILPNAASYLKKDYWLIPVASSFSTVDIRHEYRTRVAFGVFKDYPNKAIESHPYRLGTIYQYSTDLGWPTWNAQGTFSAKEVCQLTEYYKNATPNAIPGIQLQFWTDPVRPVSFDYTIQPDSTTHQARVPDAFRISTQDVSLSLNTARPIQYRLRKYRTTTISPTELRQELLWEGAWQDNGSFTFEMDPGETYVQYDIEIQYEYHIRVTDPEGTVLEDNNYVRKAHPWFAYMLVR